MGVGNLLGTILVSLLLAIGGALLIVSYVQLRKNEEEFPGSRSKGRQLAAIATSMLFICIVAIAVVEFFTGGKF